jgi:hypothetical protein
MTPAHQNKRKLLISRIEGNFEDFRCSLRGLSRRKVFDMAERTAAVKEAFVMLTKHYAWDEENEIDFYLLFRDPLTIVADALENRVKQSSDNFENAMYDVTYGGKTISEYPLMDGLDLEIYSRFN